MQAGAQSCFLDHHFLLAIDEQAKRNEVELPLYASGGGSTTYFIDPQVADFALSANLVLPSKIEQVCKIVTGAQPEVQPRNAILDQWQSNGLAAGVPWSKVPQVLQNATGGVEVRHAQLVLREQRAPSACLTAVHAFCSARVCNSFLTDFNNVQDTADRPESELQPVAAERDKAVASAKQLQFELEEATSTLRYMERLLKALKMHKKASQAAQEALQQAKQEGQILADKLEQALKVQEDLRQVIHTRDGTIREQQDALSAMEELQIAFNKATVKVLVFKAMGNVRALDAKQLTSEVKALTKVRKRLEGKLQDTEQDLQGTKAALAEGQSSGELLSGTLKQTEHELADTKHRLELEEASVARLTQKLEREKAAAVSAHTALEKSRVAHEQAMQQVQAEGGILQEACAPAKFCYQSQCNKGFGAAAVDFGYITMQVSDQTNLCRVSQLTAENEGLVAHIEEQRAQAESLQEQQSECIAILEAHIVELASRAAQVDQGLTHMRVRITTNCAWRIAVNIDPLSATLILRP